MRAATVFNFLIEAALTGSVMMMVLMIVRRFLRGRLGSGLLCAVWVMIALRLLVPIALPNPLMNELRPAWSDNVGVRPIADQVRVRVNDVMYDAADLLGRLGEPGRAIGRAVREFGFQTSYGNTARWILLVYVIVAIVTLIVLMQRKKPKGCWEWVETICCTVHWFNPLVWLSVRMCRKDRQQLLEERKERHQPVLWLRNAAFCVAAAGTVCAFCTAEWLPRLEKPIVPELSGDSVTVRTIADEAEAVDYAMEVLSSAPYLRSESLGYYDSFDMLAWEAFHAEEAGLWQVTTKPQQADMPGGDFTVVFGDDGILWLVEDHFVEIYSNGVAANPSYKTDKAAREPLFQYVRDYARYVLPGEETGKLTIHWDEIVDNRRYVNVSCEIGRFYLCLNEEAYVSCFQRSGFSQKYSALAEARRKAEAMERTDFLSLLQNIEVNATPWNKLQPGTPLADAADFASGYLTEVYSYTVADAENFCFALHEIEGKSYCIYFHPDKPQWKYAFGLDDMHSTAISPYTQTHIRAPEGPMRSFCDEVSGKVQLKRWAEEDRKAFVEMALDSLYGLMLSEEAQQHITAGEYTPAQAMKAAFEANYGDSSLWSEALNDWYETTLLKLEL